MGILDCFRCDQAGKGMKTANAPKALRNVQKEEAARKLSAQQEEELASVGFLGNVGRADSGRKAFLVHRCDDHVGSQPK